MKLLDYENIWAIQKLQVLTPFPLITKYDII